MGQESSKAKTSVEQKKPELEALLEMPWRNVNWDIAKRRDLMEFVRNYETMTEGVEHARIVLVGPVGAGKSSFFNSINNIFLGQSTNQFRTFPVIDGKGGKPLPFVLCDTMGLDADREKGLQLDDITSILKGHIEDRYEFNNLKPLQSGAPKYREHCTHGDKAHCVVYVIDTNKMEHMHPIVKERLKAIRSKVNEIDVPQLVIMTKVDEACSHVGKDLKKVYRSPYIQRKMQRMSLDLGIPMNCIIPVKNYSEEIQLDLDLDILLLTALQQMLSFSDGYFNNIPRT